MNTQLQDQLKQAAPTVVITPEPLIMEKAGDCFRGVYLGLRAFDKLNPQTGELERKPVAHFYDGERVLFNMGAQLTRAVELLPVGISVEIVLKELKANNKGGKTKIYSIAPLDIPRLDLHDLFGGLLELTAPKPEDLILPSAPMIAAPEVVPLFQNFSGLHPQTVEKWKRLVEKAVSAGVKMNFDLLIDETAETLSERVVFVKTEIERANAARLEEVLAE